MIPLEEARAHVLGSVTALPPRRVALVDALGLVLAADVVAVDPVPPFAGSAMDGYAVRAADTAGAPVTLDVVGEVAAGQVTPVVVGPGQAIRIMTGAPVPAGADAVVMVERTTTSADRRSVTVDVAVEPGTAVRPAGDDLVAGQLALAAGAPLGPGALGLAASVGRDTVEVHPRPRVGVLSTGDELVDPGTALGPGQIRDSNRLALLALLRTSGFEAVDLGRVPDDRDAVTAALRAAVEGCDAVLTSGGVSMGEHDYVKVILGELGRLRWMQVAVKPAKPLAFALVDRSGPGPSVAVPVFGLPGNPVSSMVSFELFARPALRRMAGVAGADLDRPRVEATAAEPLARRPDGKVHIARVRCRWEDGGYRVRTAGGQGSHQLSAMAVADGLAVLPDGDAVPAGGRVEVLLLGP